MKRGKPAESTPKKAARPITSFFFKQPSPSANRTTAEPEVVVVDDDDATTTTPGAKRRRAGDTETTTCVTQKPDTPSVAEHDVTLVGDVGPRRDRDPAASAEALKHIRPSLPDLHDRFLAKLALDHLRDDGTDEEGNASRGTGPGPGEAGSGSRDAGGDTRGGAVTPGDGDTPEGDTTTYTTTRGSTRPGAKSRSDQSDAGGSKKLTPLEEQVKQHKKDHPGVLLLIEVGYKFHFYGQDARIASKVLNIFAYQSRAFLTASVPVQRLHVYVRRLVDAGHKVGVIRQTETAALKAAGESDTGSKSGLFQRKLVGLYTKSTLEAGVAVTENGGTNDQGESFGAGADAGPRNSYLLVVCEAEVVGEGGDTVWSDPSTTQVPGSIPGQGGRGQKPRVRIGVAAVDCGTGDVAHCDFTETTDQRHGLESRLLSIAPAEVLLVEPVSSATKRLIHAMFGDGGGGGVRVEVIDETSGYKNGGALEAVTKTVREASLEKPSPTGEKEYTQRIEPGTSGGTSEHHGSSQALPPQEALLSTLQRLPPQTLRATAVAFDWLSQFGLAGVATLLGTRSFRPMSLASGEMRLSPNVIRQLELLRSSDDTYKGSLLWLLSANAVTAQGGRALRRWVVGPLTDTNEIRARLCAVAELRDAAEPAMGGALQDLGEALTSCYSPKTGWDAERYLARVFHGTATPAELVNALCAVKSFANSIHGMAAGSGTKSKNNTSSQQTESTNVDRLATSPMLVHLLCEASDPAVVHLCETLLAAVDLECVQHGKATPATALRPDPVQFPELEVTRSGVEVAVRAMDDLLPVLREQLVSGSDGGGAGTSEGTKGKGTKGKGVVLGTGTKKHLLPATLVYVTVALVEFLIELSDSFQNVPHDWVRVSTNKSKKVIRYHPPAVVEKARALERARERHVTKCAAAWVSFLKVQCAGNFLALRAAVRAAAGLDALCSLASLGRQDGYCAPEFVHGDDEGGLNESSKEFGKGGLNESSKEVSKDASHDSPSTNASLLEITQGRHPILDATLVGGQRVVPNSLRLGGGENQKKALCITGPNMGGKSVFVRQTALLVLMAQIGSFVPAVAMRLTAFNGVHTRMGASDNLATGSSTFLEEMAECAGILAAVKTEAKSLVVLDELGRGTSTHDGVAVAYATLEHLLSAQNKNALTLFVTHYPNVARDVTANHPTKCGAAFTAYAEKKKAVRKNSKGKDGGEGAEKDAPEDSEKDSEKNSPVVEIDFLYHITPGVAHRSFGLNVARMAGVPVSVLGAAAKKASELERLTATRAARLEIASGGNVSWEVAADTTGKVMSRVVTALKDARDVHDLGAIQTEVRAWYGT